MISDIDALISDIDALISDIKLIIFVKVETHRFLT